MNKKRFLVVFFGLVLGLGGLWYGSWHQETKPLDKHNLIRLHVIANSDSVYDQKIKLLVRDEVIKFMAPYFEQAKTVREARAVALAEMPAIKNVAEHSLASLGMNYDASVEMGNFDFPTKAYGNLVLPAGEYEAVRIVLGEGLGRNWWCVLYPPLCFIDASSTVAVEQRAVLDDEQSRLVDARPAQIEIHFKLLDEVRAYLGKRIARID